MGHKRYSSKRGGLTASVAAVALVLTGVPTAGFALDALGKGGLNLAANAFPFTPASVDPKLAKFVTERSTGTARMMRFTPAGVAERGKQSLTVAVRIDEESAQAIQVRSAIATAQDQMGGASGVRIVSARYNLGMARGYQSFAQPTVLSKNLADAAIPDLSTFKPAPIAQPDQSRLVSRVALAHDEKPGVHVVIAHRGNAGPEARLGKRPDPVEFKALFQARTDAVRRWSGQKQSGEDDRLREHTPLAARTTGSKAAESAGTPSP